MIEKYNEQEDDLNISDEREVSGKVYILEGELYEFHYKNEKGEMLSFIADELIASEFIEDHTGSDSFFVEQIGGEIIVEKNSIPHILEDIPEIIDCDLVGSIITYGEFNTLQEAKDFINNLKSISFDSINPEDGQCIRYIH